MTQVVVARMVPPPLALEDLGVSVVIPCENEKGNVDNPGRRFRFWADGTEIIFRDDQLTDGTPEERNIGRHASCGCIRDAFARHHQPLRSRWLRREITIVDAPFYIIVSSLMRADSKAQPDKVAFGER
jgi:hypothetical protein